MDIETDPAAEFLSREKEELGSLSEIVNDNGKLIKLIKKQYTHFFYRN
jgi:hypothetical protein